MPRPESIAGPGFTVRLPASEEIDLDQDAEWCIVEIAGERRRIRFHDYAAIYAIPGLYELLFYKALECDSPHTVRKLVAGVLDERGTDPATLSVLDVGAGNGMVAEQFAELGVESIVGVDILPEAAKAAQRDRPGVYDNYRAVDLTQVPPDVDELLGNAGFNCMTSVAALGFGDIPPRAFARAYNYVRPGGLIAFTIKQEFLSEADATGFSRLIRRMLDSGVLSGALAERRYRHRLSVAGEPLYYVAYVAEKVEDVPDEWTVAT
ncbi:MAG: class I SAM-dependent DNA methyltransferase [Streptosporangiales bacterium]